MQQRNKILNNHYLVCYRVSSLRHGGTKAISDANKIFLECGATAFDVTFSKHAIIAMFQFSWILIRLAFIGKRARFILQLPEYGSLKKIVAKLLLNHFRCMILLHDLDEFRSLAKVNTSSNLVLKAEKIISTGELLSLIGQTTANDNHVVLSFWDYLLDSTVSNAKRSLHGSILFAGNLIRIKIPALYQKKDRPPFLFYGINYEPALNENEHDIYIGSFDSNNPALESEVSFGLIWEGSKSDHSRYEQYNQPHKMSLYLALGMPLIVWSGACCASRIKSEGIGITVDDLSDINAELAKLTTQDYQHMCNNAERLGQKIRHGEFLKEAIEKLLA